MTKLVQVVTAVFDVVKVLFAAGAVFLWATHGYKNGFDEKLDSVMISLVVAAIGGPATIQQIVMRWLKKREKACPPQQSS